VSTLKKIFMVAAAMAALVAGSILVRGRTSDPGQGCEARQTQGYDAGDAHDHNHEHRTEATLATARVIEATVTGRNFCLGCTLKKECGAAAQCSLYGHTHSLRVTQAVADGKELPEMKGWVLHYLATDKSQDLLHKIHDGTWTVTGKVYPHERVLEVISYEETPQPQAKAEPVHWHDSLSAALAEARERKTLLLVDAYAPWCAWCRKLEADTLSEPAVQAKLKEFTLLKIDTDKHADVAARYGVTSLPTTLILNEKGEVVFRQAGYLPPKDYLRLLAHADEHTG
jgi:thiol-disulfide isomerase/thioredoxin